MVVYSCKLDIEFLKDFKSCDVVFANSLWGNFIPFPFLCASVIR